MAILDRLSDVKRKFTTDSTSWGSLLLLALGCIAVVLFMVLYTPG